MMTSPTRRPARTYNGSAIYGFLATGQMVRNVSREQLPAYLDLWRARLDSAPKRTHRHAIAVGAKLAVETELKRVGR